MKSDVLARLEDTVTSTDIVVHYSWWTNWQTQTSRLIWYKQRAYGIPVLLCYVLDWHFFSLYDWRNGLGNLIDSQDQKLPVSVCCGRKQTCRRHRVNVVSYQLDWQSRLTWCICLWLLWERICWTAAASPAKSSPVVQSGLEGHLWGLSTVHCMLCRYRQAKRTSLIFFFFAARLTSVVSLFFLFLNEGWQLFFSHSFSPLIPFLLCSASFFATSFEGWEGKEGRSKRTRTLCPPISLGYLWWHY